MLKIDYITKYIIQVNIETIEVDMKIINQSGTM